LTWLERADIAALPSLELTAKIAQRLP